MAGQAKLRGTFEQRKAQAIAEGRAKEMKVDVKVCRFRKSPPVPNPEELMVIGTAMAGCEELTRSLLNVLNPPGLMIVGDNRRY